jgi:hypothetical protein
LADELEETRKKFGKITLLNLRVPQVLLLVETANDFDAWGRPSPDLPSDLRMLKYQNLANVQKLAAKKLRERNGNFELAAEV